MMTRAERHLERLVSRETAARKVASLRGDAGREGGWIYSPGGRPVCQGWRAYADRMQSAGKIGRDADTGKWYVSVVWLTMDERAAGERLYGAQTTAQEGRR